MEYRCRKGCIRMPQKERIPEMLLATCTTTGDDRYREIISKFAQSLIGIALLHSVMIHRSKEYLSCSTFLSLVSPFEETSFGTFTTSLEITVPAILVITGIDGNDTYLGTETRGYLIDKLRITDGG